MADVKENQMGKVTSIADGAHIRMLDTNGKSVQIDKSNFIEAVRAAMPEATTALNGLLSATEKKMLDSFRIIKLNTSGGAGPHFLRESGMYIVYGCDSSNPAIILFILHTV